MKNADICEGSCCGCGACYATCPTNAIKMVENSKGFIEPNIIHEKCTNCGMCRTICNLQIKRYEPIDVNIAKHRDNVVYLSSQSGGAFTAISDIVLSNGGIVYGAAMSDVYEPLHIRTSTTKDRDKLRGSKYLQSHCEHVYNDIESDLKKGIQVLFSGTPCQVDGVIKYLEIKKIDTTNFISVDILCHGVPSVLIWRDLIKYYSNKYNENIDDLVFTDCNKEERPIYHYKFSNQLIPCKLHLKFFFSNLSLRDSCYRCTFASKHRVSDFTIGDAWGVKEQNPEFHSNSGISLFMYNTKKSLSYNKIIENSMIMKKVDIDNYMQLPLTNPHKPNRPAEGFWKDYNTKTIEYMINKYAKHKLLYNLDYFTIRLIKLIFKRK